ncbi:head GIN domain-containing protein [Algoriphagus kandeliae]|nr:head GIN domain-containing protein [Algoriphagus kandeliae]
MMKRTIIPALILFLFFLGLSANAQEVETRTPGNFTQVESGGSWDVYISIGNRDEVEIEATNVSLDNVITEVDNGKLKLRLKKGNYRNVKLKFYVTMRELEGIGCSGSGTITVENDFDTDRLSLGVSGSGSIILPKVKANEIYAGISGSADIEIAGGEADKLKIGQSGSGDFKGMDLQARSVDVGKSGSGETYITALDELKVGASGSGDVFYKGNPRTNIGVSGSAKVIKK